MRHKLFTGQLSIIREWHDSKIQECNRLIDQLTETSIVDVSTRNTLHDQIRDCEEAIDYYAECIRTGTTD
jgi:phage terminase Nu1 subunit (DNA packaging protein)